jgi:hypothetical protein
LHEIYLAIRPRQEKLPLSAAELAGKRFEGGIDSTPLFGIESLRKERPILRENGDLPALQLSDEIFGISTIDSELEKEARHGNEPKGLITGQANVL